VRPLSPRYLVGLAALCLPGGALAQDIYLPGERVEEAINAQITAEGFDSLETVVEGLIPTLLDDALGGTTLGPIDLAGILTIDNAAIEVEVANVNLAPRNGKLVLDVDARVYLGTRQQPMDLSCLFGDEQGWIGPIDVNLGADIAIAVLTGQGGERSFDVEVATTIDANIDAPGLFSEGDFHDFGFCGDSIGFAIGIFQDAVIDLVLGPLIDPVLGDLEVTIEDALAAASIVQSIPILDATLDIALEPKTVAITNDGMELKYSFTGDTAPAACVAEYDPGFSLKTLGPPLAITALDPGTQVAAHIADDLVNQFLYIAFRGGVLCYTVDANSGLDLPISLDTSLLGLLGGEGYRDLFTEPSALTIKTRPKVVPTATFGGGNDITIHIEQLGLDFMGDLDYRQARLLGLEAAADAGVDLAFDGTTGALGVVINPDELGLDLQVVPDVLVAGSEDAIEAGLGGLVDTLVGSLVTPLLSGLNFTIPSFSGIGLESLDLRGTGQGRTWLTGYVTVGEVAYGDPAAGCDSTTGGCSSGCDTSSCSSGCSSVGFNLGGWATFLVPFWMMRRRRD
jgi:hypothetical protein